MVQKGSAVDLVQVIKSMWILMYTIKYLWHYFVKRWFCAICTILLVVQAMVLIMLNDASVRLAISEKVANAQFVTVLNNNLLFLIAVCGGISLLIGLISSKQYEIELVLQLMWREGSTEDDKRIPELINYLQKFLKGDLFPKLEIPAQRDQQSAEEYAEQVEQLRKDYKQNLLVKIMTN